MDDIPQDVLYEAHTAEPGQLLRVVAGHFADRAERLRSLRKKGWQTANRELDGVADHIRAYAEQLEQFAANNPDGERPAPVIEPHPDAVPGLPGNTGRCASFRRSEPDDQTLCSLPRGHSGDHASTADGVGIEHTWPRKHSGAVCGDVVILPDGQALNCARELGHDGDEHYDGRFRLWPRGVGTSRQVRTCERCNYDKHECPGCGDPVGHFKVACDGCNDDPAGSAVVLAETHEMLPPTDDELFPGQCAARQGDERCMLPGTHTGKHKGRKGTGWDRTVETVVETVGGPAVVTHAVGSAVTVTPGDGGDFIAVTQTMSSGTTLAEIADQQRATMVIPEQRPESDPVPVFTIRESDGAAVYNGAMAAPEMAHVADPLPAFDGPVAVSAMTPAAHMVAEMKEEVSATVAEFTMGRQTEHGPVTPPTLSNPFAPAIQALSTVTPPTLSNPFQAPPPPPLAFLPPHLVPGAPKAHQSHSSITTMEKCGLQYRLKYRDGIGDDTPAWWNVAGTAFHIVVQTIEAAHASGHVPLWATDAPLMEQERSAAAMWKAAFNDQTAKTEDESGKARSTWRAAKGGKEGEAFWREYGGDLARMYVAHRRRFLAEPEGWRLLSKPDGEGWAHEVEFNATVDGVLLRGFIDSAWISADGATILIEDFKSGSSEGDPFQPKLYGAALRALGFIPSDRRMVTRFYEARKGAHSATVELTTADDAEVSYRANTAQQMDRMGIFPPSPSSYNCSTCPVKSRCPIMATKG